MEFFYKAADNSSNSAGFHKWYAIGLLRLQKLNKSDKYAVNAKDKIHKHFQKAVELDPKDPLTWHFFGSFLKFGLKESLFFLNNNLQFLNRENTYIKFLGLYYFENKNYKNAMEAFMKAEDVKVKFTYLGFNIL